MSISNFQEDLFQPSLTEEDDATGFHEPWSPWALVMLSFFFSLASGGTLLAINFNRLGMRRWFYPALALVILVTLGTCGFLFWATTHGLIAPKNRGSASTFRMVTRACHVAIAIGMASMQRRRFRLHQFSGLQTGKLWIPAILASVGSIVANLAVVFVLAVMARVSPSP
ncbi:MAG: hypothetical protein HY318_00480 [Armatimonadetes bacterium]|nr:hypothetical protein [Armatimonadota bacterium]